MSDENEGEIVLALRRRIQQQALCHRVGQSVAGQIVMRFRLAGLWDSDIARPIPPLLLPVLTQPNHDRRLPLPNGPLVAVIDDDCREIIEVAEHLLSHDISLRNAALHHFLSAECDREIWLSPYVLTLLKQNAGTLNIVEESSWIATGILLQDAIELDFRSNCAGVRQASRLQFNESYQEYFDKVIRPSARCFEHDRPPVWNPFSDKDQVLKKFDEWASLDNLDNVLNQYLDFCGYLPLASDLSAGTVIALWASRHSEHDVWRTVWTWAEASSNLLASYHAAHAFLEHPNWVRHEESEKLIKVVRGIISSSEVDSSYSQAPLWQLRAHLQQHYQYHMESLIPGLQGEVAATTACWMTDWVAKLFSADPNHVKNSCKYISSDILPLSIQRWSMARTRMSASPLRVANLYSPFIWSDSLLATAVRRFKEFPESDFRDEYRKILLTQLTSAICVGSLRVFGQRNTAYAFEQAVSPSDLELSDYPMEDHEFEAARQVLAARLVIETGTGLKDLLASLQTLEEGLSSFLCTSLRCLPIEQSHSDAGLRDLFNDGDWRRTVFHRLPLDTLEKLLSFLTEWQLQQDEEWLTRVPQLLAYEFENEDEPERSDLLLFWTIVSSMAADVASPIVRLLSGPKRPKISGQFEIWRQATREIARDSEQWLAARVRGVLGTIENSF